MKILFAVFVFLCCLTTRAEDTSCHFDTNKLSFPGTPLEQSRCLLRPVAPHGRLGKQLEHLPAPLENLIGKPFKIKIADIQKYLASEKINEADIGGALTNHCGAKYFVIHDTSTPNYGDQPIPTNINTSAWSLNNLDRYTNRAVAHMFVNRLGKSWTGHTFASPYRATKLEVRVVGDKSRGVFVHT